MRLGLFIDAAFRRRSVDGAERLFRGPGDFGFMHFAAAVGEHLGGLDVVARETDDAAEAPNVLPPGLRLVPLPHYPSLRHIGPVARAVPGTLTAMWRALAELDAVWVTGAHPLGLLFALLALVRRRRVVLLIRQDTPRYFEARTSGLAGALIRLPIAALDLAFRLLARRLPTTVVGAEVAQRYGGPRPNLLEMRINLLSSGELASGPSTADWSGTVELLTVGRIDREKNPMIAVRMLEELERADPGRFRLTWVGSGPLAEPLADEARRCGLDGRLSLPGYVPFGPELLERYRFAHAFVHIALTEGVPQVLYEAMGAGLPIVATEVGGVGPALENGTSGLLVPPADPDALAAAVLRLSRAPDLREALARHALELAQRGTIESESAKVAGFIRAGA
jgi:glycosyltransferase involved in cell wall biosynthesis